MSESPLQQAAGEAATPHPAPADDWDRLWEAFSEASARNPAVAYRARLMAKLLGAGGAPERLLDIGVGSGDFLELAASHWPTSELAGVDISQAGVRRAADRVPRALMAVEDLTAPGGAPDGLEGWATHAVCSEVLEHVDDPVALLRRSLTMMAPGCRVVITVPSGKMSAFERHIGHRRHFEPAELESALREAGYGEIELILAGFPFFNLYRQVIRVRGEALIEDVGAQYAGANGPAKLPVRVGLAMRVFGGLFRLNLSRSRWGLQLVALARSPGSDARRASAGRRSP